MSRGSSPRTPASPWDFTWVGRSEGQPYSLQSPSNSIAMVHPSPQAGDRYNDTNYSNRSSSAVNGSYHRESARSQVQVGDDLVEHSGACCTIESVESKKEDAPLSRPLPVPVVSVEE